MRSFIGKKRIYIMINRLLLSYLISCVRLFSTSPVLCINPYLDLVPLNLFTLGGIFDISCRYREKVILEIDPRIKREYSKFFPHVPSNFYIILDASLLL